MDPLRSAISLRQLHYLVAVADAGSFSAAADQTHVAQPALSRQIALLETQVGLRLLNRSRKGVALTEGGVRLYNLARSTLERIGSVQMELQAAGKKPGGVVTLALPTSLASMLVPKVVRELEARYPAIVLRVDDGLSPENRRSLETGVIDFGIVPAADELVDVDYEPLVRESLLLVERRSGPGPVPPTIAFDRVMKLKLIMPPRTFHTRRVVEDVALTTHHKLNIVHEQRSVTTIMSLVRAGLGGTITNSPAVKQFWAPGSVTVRRIVRPEITRTISLAWPVHRTLSLAARAVYDIVKRLAIEAVKDGRWQGTPLC
jgi:LysR family transcriptional regulator, nitrogen assimilation regulatory protein